jgi:hypothetical protein
MKTSLAQAFNSLEQTAADLPDSAAEKIATQKDRPDPPGLLDVLAARLLGDADPAVKATLNADEAAVTGGAQPQPVQGAQAEPVKFSAVRAFDADRAVICGPTPKDMKANALDNLRQIGQLKAAATGETAPQAQGLTLGRLAADTVKGSLVGAAIAAFAPAALPAFSAISAGMTAAAVVGQGSLGAPTASRRVETRKPGSNRLSRGVIADPAPQVDLTAAASGSFNRGSAAPADKTLAKLNNGPGFGPAPAVSVVGESLAGITGIGGQNKDAYAKRLDEMERNCSAVVASLNRREKDGVAAAGARDTSLIVDLAARQALVSEVPVDQLMSAFKGSKLRLPGAMV